MRGRIQGTSQGFKGNRTIDERKAPGRPVGLIAVQPNGHIPGAFNNLALFFTVDRSRKDYKKVIHPQPVGRLSSYAKELHEATFKEWGYMMNRAEKRKRARSDKKYDKRTQFTKAEMEAANNAAYELGMKFALEAAKAVPGVGNKRYGQIKQGIREIEKREGITRIGALPDEHKGE